MSRVSRSMGEARNDPKVHARFLTYRERHVYFGRGDQRTPLTLDQFAVLDGERDALIARPRAELTVADRRRLAEIDALLHLD
jgi:hypothetical protein